MSQILMNITATSPISETNVSELSDFSLQKRIGLRGNQARAYLENVGYELPQKANSVIDNDDYTSLQLAYDEYWLLSKSSTMMDISSAKEAYPVLCESSHAWLVLESENKAAILSMVCGVDLRQSVFPQGQLVQTVVAGISTIIVHHRLEQKAVFSLLCDRSYVQYLWDVLNDVIGS